MQIHRASDEWSPVFFAAFETPECDYKNLPFGAPVELPYLGDLTSI